jgi:acyl-CoA thioesterase-2
LNANDRTPLEALIDSLAVEQTEENRFVGDPGEGERRLFGGYVAAQAAIAVGHTVVGADLHSLHAYFLRPGRYGVPIEYAVDRIRDGRSFATRRVVASQQGEAILNLAGSFARPEEGPGHQDPAPPAPEPEELTPLRELQKIWWGEDPPSHMLREAIEIRLNDPLHYEPGVKPDPMRQAWMRLTGPPPEDPLLRSALAIYASDRTLIGTALRPSGRQPGRKNQATSLDHAFWLHEVPALDDWFLYSAQSPMARSARALVHGAMFDRGGRRFASVTQEGLIRLPRASS